MDPLKSVRSLDPAKRVFSLLDEFKAFALKGNVIDLAVGVIIGAAFGKIVDSLVKQIIMPLVSVVLPARDEEATVGDASSRVLRSLKLPESWLGGSGSPGLKNVPFEFLMPWQGGSPFFFGHVGSSKL